MAKIRVYELAKELGKDNKEMETVIRGLGVEIKGVMSTLDDDQAQMVRRRMQGGDRREPGRPSPSAGSPGGAASGAGQGNQAGQGGQGGQAPQAGQPASPAMVIRRRSVGPRPGEDDETSAPPAMPSR
ncbi:MAG TPA: translation initiation factor IF-2 N-terminal domain-containing protein, partial [Nannocystis sp.]